MQQQSKLMRYPVLYELTYHMALYPKSLHQRKIMLGSREKNQLTAAYPHVNMETLTHIQGLKIVWVDNPSIMEIH